MLAYALALARDAHACQDWEAIEGLLLGPLAQVAKDHSVTVAEVVEAWCLLSESYACLERFDQALSVSREALAAAEHLPAMHPMRATAHEVGGDAQLGLDAAAQALPLLTKALAIRRHHIRTEPAAVLETANMLAAALAADGADAKALRLLRSLLKDARLAAAGPRALAIAHLQVGTLLDERDHDEAPRHLAAALKLARRSGDGRLVAECATVLASHHLAMGRPKRVLQLLDQALAVEAVPLQERIGLLILRAEACADAARPDDAAASLEQAGLLLGGLTDAGSLQVDLATAWATCYRACGEHAAEESALAQAIILLDADDAQRRLDLTLERAQALLADERPLEAERILRELAALPADADGEPRASHQRLLAECLEAQCRPAAAEGIALDALREAIMTRGPRSDLALDWLDFLEDLYADNGLEEAAARLRRSLRSCRRAQAIALPRGFPP